jgi:predicted PurR-regulated permease PerM
MQFSDLLPVALVAVTYLTGQTAESYLLTPNLVGNRIGLHPAWILFALLAFGALFGFVGVLLAVPLAAIIGVLGRFVINRYLASTYYKGSGNGGEEQR